MGQRHTLQHLGANERRGPKKTVQEVRGSPRETMETSRVVSFTKERVSRRRLLERQDLKKMLYYYILAVKRTLENLELFQGVGSEWVE